MSPRTKLLYLDNDLMSHLASIPLHSILYNYIDPLLGGRVTLAREVILVYGAHAPRVASVCCATSLACSKAYI